MNILDIIKRRCSIREYQKKAIPKNLLDKIIEAGVWGPSLANFQPENLIVIKNKKVINKIKYILINNFEKLGISGRTVFLPLTIKVVKSAPILIAIYNSGEFIKLINKFSRLVSTSEDNIYMKVTKQTEISAISATIQNMILTAESLGIGSCWLSVPLFFTREINRLLNVKKGELVALLALGFPAEKGKRSQRRRMSDMVKYI